MKYKHILFDVDDTLYPKSSGLQDEIRRRIVEYGARFLDMDLEDFLELRKARFPHYGTTLKWLESEHGFTDVEEYLEHAHPVDLGEFISPNPRLVRLLDTLDVPCSVFTNSPREHARRVIRFLGIEDHFQGLYDIRFHQFLGKPHDPCYKRVLEAINTRAEDVLFLDDSPMYLEGFARLGGDVLLIDEEELYDGHFPSVKTSADLESFLKQA